MSEKVWVTALPEKLPWVEGVDYALVPGAPPYGVPVRIRDNAGESFQMNTAPGTAFGTPGPREVRKWEFATFATAAVGGAATFGAIVKACRDSADNAVIGAYELFKSQATLTKNEADALLTLLVAKSIVTAQQKTDILAAWPAG